MKNFLIIVVVWVTRANTNLIIQSRVSRKYKDLFGCRIEDVYTLKIIITLELLYSIKIILMPLLPSIT